MEKLTKEELLDREIAQIKEKYDELMGQIKQKEAKRRKAEYEGRDEEAASLVGEIRQLEAMVADEADKLIEIDCRED